MNKIHYQVGLVFVVVVTVWASRWNRLPNLAGIDQNPLPVIELILQSQIHFTEAVYVPMYLPMLPTNEMLHTNPILVIENDEDDQILLKAVFNELAVVNPVHFFTTTDQALSYLQSTAIQPFITFCSTSLPVHDGIRFKKFLEHNESMVLGIPFVFLSTQVHSQFVKKAFSEISLQGIFIKPDTYEGFKELIQTIYSYWQYSMHPDEKG